MKKSAKIKHGVENILRFLSKRRLPVGGIQMTFSRKVVSTKNALPVDTKVRLFSFVYMLLNIAGAAP